MIFEYQQHNTIITPTQTESLKPPNKHSKEIYGKYKIAAEKRKGTKRKICVVLSGLVLKRCI